jgi:hypothetical protein
MCILVVVGKGTEHHGEGGYRKARGAHPVFEVKLTGPRRNFFVLQDIVEEEMSYIC